MTSTSVKDRAAFRGHSPDQKRPLGGYATLIATFLAAWGSFGAWFVASGRELPDTIEARDLALAAVATHKLSRVIAKDRVTSTRMQTFAAA